MPAYMDFEEGTLGALLENAGFCDVKTADLSENVKPMLRLFFVAAYVPYLIIKAFGLEAYFVNNDGCYCFPSLLSFPSLCGY